MYKHIVFGKVFVISSGVCHKCCSKAWAIFKKYFLRKKLTVFETPVDG